MAEQPGSAGVNPENWDCKRELGTLSVMVSLGGPLLRVRSGGQREEKGVRRRDGGKGPGHLGVTSSRTAARGRVDGFPRGGVVATAAFRWFSLSCRLSEAPLKGLNWERDF